MSGGRAHPPIANSRQIKKTSNDGEGELNSSPFFAQISLRRRLRRTTDWVCSQSGDERGLTFRRREGVEVSYSSRLMVKSVEEEFQCGSEEEFPSRESCASHWKDAAAAGKGLAFDVLLCLTCCCSGCLKEVIEGGQSLRQRAGRQEGCRS